MSMDDLLHDPHFPDRPNHPDYWRLSEIVLQLDAQTLVDEVSIEDQVAKDVNIDSEFYIAVGRALRFRAKMDGPIMSPTEFTAFCTALWTEGFLVGCRFQQRGGKQ